MRVLCVFGTRPEAIKMAPVIWALARCAADVSVRICVSAQHRQMLDQMLALFKIHPDIDLDLMEPEQTLAHLTSQLIERMTTVLEEERPDWVLVQGDTTTAMTTALASFYQRVAVGHIEAGLRTNDPYNPFPEEINRRIVSKLASLHFAPTERARQSLLAEDIREQNVFLTGNTIVDALRSVLAAPPSKAASQLLVRFEDWTSRRAGKCLHNQRIVLVTAHRRESFGERFDSMCRGIRRLADENPGILIVYPVHLNPEVQRPVNRLLGSHPRIHLLEPLAYEPFIRLMNLSYLVLTDSGGIQEEASVLGKPVLVLRRVTERKEIIDAGIGRLVGTDGNAIAEEGGRLLRDPDLHRAMEGAKDLYGDGHAAERIVDTLLNHGQSTKKRDSC